MSETPQFHLPTRVNRPGFEWAIGFDKHLASLLDSEGIVDANEQMRICEMFRLLGLAKHRLFGEKDTKAAEHQEHYYATTRKMRKLLQKQVY